MKQFNKKGSVFDNLYIFLWFFIAAIVFVVILLVWNSFNEGYTATSTTGQGVLDIFENDIKPQYDYMVFGMYMAAMVITFILAYLIKMHRIFIVVSFVFTIATYLVTSVLSNVYGSFIAEATLAGGAASLPITNFVIDKFPVFYIVFAIILIFVMAISEELG